MLFKYAIVLTGGIATGKSTVGTFFLKDGFTVIDADKIAHKVLDSSYEKVAKLFGNQYIKEKKVDRKALGALIFSDVSEKKRLEALIHPLIFSEIERLAYPLEVKRMPYIIDIPLFFEKERYSIEKSIVVYTPENIQLERLIKRDSSTELEAKKRIKNQLSIEKKKELATYIIDNSKDLDHLYHEYYAVKKEIEQSF